MKQAEEYIRAITAATDRIDYLYDNWARSRGINSYVSRIMYMLYASGIDRQKDIAENYGMPKQTVNNVISDLLKKGYITLETDEKDRRSKLIRLTEEGEKYAGSITEPLLECEKSVLEEMGGERARMLTETMTQYADLLEEEMKKRSDK